MAILHNRINGSELKEQLRRSKEERITCSFYKYIPIDDPESFRDALYRKWSEFNILGRIYIAREGINAQFSIPVKTFDDFEKYLSASAHFSGVLLNKAIDDDGKSFFKLKILVRRKIVADGLADKDFDVTDSGIHLDAESFNRITDQPGTLLIDMRNHYESEVGHFENAVIPDTDTFKETLRHVDKMLEGKEDQKIVMYCTGGIRCEKATAYYKHKGFSSIYQLKGGIINYAREVKEKRLPNKFKGKNFVFDERLGERISPEIISVCHQCGKPCDDHTNCRNDTCHLLFIQCQECKNTYSGCCSDACAKVIALPESERYRLRKGRNPGKRIYKKGRSGQLLFKSKS